MLPGIAFLAYLAAVFGLHVSIPSEDAALVDAAGFVDQAEMVLPWACGEAEHVYEGDEASHTVRIAWPLPYGCEDVRYTVAWEVGRVVAVERFRAQLDSAGPVGSEARRERSAEIARWYVWSLGVRR